MSAASLSRIALPTRMQGACIDDLGGGKWRIWLHTVDHVYGTYLELYSNGKVNRVTTRPDEGDEIWMIKS